MFLLALPLATKITIATIIAVTIFGSGLYLGNKIGVSSCQQAVIDSQVHTIAAIKEQVVISDQVTTEYVNTVAKIQTKSREVLTNAKIPTTSLSGDFRLFHDAAADPFSQATRTADAASVEAQDLADTISANYSSCNQNSATLEALQDWVRKQALVE
jgi:hypothetical protein